jgi:hypothetical protein
MVESYFFKPSTVDRIRGSWLGPEIERYVEWIASEGYAVQNVYRPVPILCQFAEFAKLHGSTDAKSATSHIEEFASHWLASHGSKGSVPAARSKIAEEARNPVRQMLRLALDGRVAAAARAVAEIDALFEGLPRDGNLALRDRTLLMFLYNTGARVQEAADLSTWISTSMNPSGSASTVTSACADINTTFSIPPLQVTGTYFVLLSQQGNDAPQTAMSDPFCRPIRIFSRVLSFPTLCFSTSMELSCNRAGLWISRFSITEP